LVLGIAANRSPHAYRDRKGQDAPLCRWISLQPPPPATNNHNSLELQKSKTATTCDPPVDPLSCVPLELDDSSLTRTITLCLTPLQHHVLASRGIHSLRDHEVACMLRPNRLRLRDIGHFRTFIAVDKCCSDSCASPATPCAMWNEHHRLDGQDHPQRGARRSQRSAVHPRRYEKAFLEDAAMIGIEQPKLVRATENIPQMGFVAKLLKGTSPTAPTMDRITSYRESFPAMGSFQRKDFSGMLDGARVDVDEIRQRQRPRTLRCGRRPSRARLPGIVPLVRDVPAGTWNAVIVDEDGARASICTPAEKTSSFPHTKTRSRNRSRSPRDIRALLVSCALSASKERDVEEFRKPSTRCAILC